MSEGKIIQEYWQIFKQNKGAEPYPVGNPLTDKALINLHREHYKATERKKWSGKVIVRRYVVLEFEETE